MGGGYGAALAIGQQDRKTVGHHDGAGQMRSAGGSGVGARGCRPNWHLTVVFSAQIHHLATMHLLQKHRLCSRRDSVERRLQYLPIGMDCRW